MPETLAAHQQPELSAVLQTELQRQAHALPLQQALRQGSVALTDDLGVMLHAIEERPDQLHLRLGLLFQGIIAGCQCADAPTADARVPEYAELTIRIDKQTAQAQVLLCSD